MVVGLEELLDIFHSCRLVEQTEVLLDSLLLHRLASSPKTGTERSETKSDLFAQSQTTCFPFPITLSGDLTCSPMLLRGSFSPGVKSSMVTATALKVSLVTIGAGYMIEPFKKLFQILICVEQGT